MQLNHLHFQSFKTVFTEVVVKKYEVCLLRFTIRIRHKSMRSSPRYPMTNSSNHLFRRRVTRPDTRPPTCLFDLGTQLEISLCLRERFIFYLSVLWDDDKTQSSCQLLGYPTMSMVLRLQAPLHYTPGAALQTIHQFSQSRRRPLLVLSHLTLCYPGFNTMLPRL